MPCLIAIIALAFPRIVLLALFLLSNYLHNAYDTLLWPLLGFIFLPLTTLAYAFAINSNAAVAGWHLLLLVLAVLFDLGLFSTSTPERRRSHD